MAMRYETYARTFGVKACEPGRLMAIFAIALAPLVPAAGLPMAISAGEHSGRFVTSKHLSQVGVRLNLAFLIVHGAALITAIVLLLIAVLQ